MQVPPQQAPGSLKSQYPLDGLQQVLVPNEVPQRPVQQSLPDAHVEPSPAGLQTGCSTTQAVAVATTFVVGAGAVLVRVAVAVGFKQRQLHASDTLAAANN